MRSNRALRTKKKNLVWLIGLTVVVTVMSMQRIRLVQGFLSRSSRSTLSRTTRQRLSPQQLSHFHHFSPPTCTRRNRPLLVAAARSSTSAAAVSQKPSKDRPYQLVIVESPSKCKTIANILQTYVTQEGLDYDYVVASSMGHVRNLPRSGGSGEKKQAVVGVNIDDNYQPTYVILPGKENLVKELQSLAKGAQRVVLATDEDREGEAVAW